MKDIHEPIEITVDARVRAIMRPGRYSHALSDAEKARIVKLDKQGVKRIRIAESFGVSPSTITNVIRKFKERKKE